MVPTPTKRHASNSPDGARPPKRALTSSPEEGEVDDATVLPGSANLPPRPASPPRPLAKAKIAFPFKKKTDIVSNGVGVENRDKTLPIVYERSQEDERRIREADMKRTSIRGIQGDSRRRGPSTLGDHWEPSYSRDNPSIQRGGPRDGGHYHGDRHHSTYNSRDRDRSVREWRSEWDHSTSSSSIRGNHHRRDRDRDRATPSPSPPNRSRTPSSHSSQPREKHRLPAPRSPEPSFSPPHRNYSSDRVRDRDRKRDRGQDQDWERRHHDNRSDHSHPRNHERAREPRQHESLDDHERYWRPELSTSVRHDHSQDRNSWSRGDFVDHESRLEDGEEDDEALHRAGQRQLNGYHQSPHESPITITTPEPLRGSPRLGPHTPPPPSVSPPPPPPPIDQHLPVEHALVSIPLPMKRPGAPKDMHSPPSLRLPVAEDIDGNAPKDKHKTPETARVDGHAPEKSLDSFHGRGVPMVRKRVPVRRSPKEEEAAYGRVFKGCGKKSDYEITTKLGEGTFGCA